MNAWICCAFVVLGALLLVGGGDRAAGDSDVTVLPGKDGLAARYPGDGGLHRDPAVVFADGVESAAGEVLERGLASERRSTWNNVWDHAWGRIPVARDPSRVHSGLQALELTTDRPGGAGTSKYFSPGFDRLFLRYYIKYDELFPGAHHVGGALESRAPGLPHATPGIRPDGTNKFTVLLDHWAFDRSVRPPGHLVAYVYHMDQQHQWGEQFYPSGRTQPGVNGARGLFGPSFVRRRDFVPERGRWYCYELMVQANRPAERDGRVAFWVDGALMGDFPNLRFRTVDTLKINRVDLGLYESRRMPVQRVWIDDVVVATSYIGPMVSKRD